MASMSRFVLGGLVGAAVGLLLAPKSGRELRQSLMGGAAPSLPGATETSHEGPTSSAAVVTEPLIGVEPEPVVEATTEVISEPVVEEQAEEEQAEQAEPSDPGRVAADLEARLDESRRQVEQELEGMEAVDAGSAEVTAINEAEPVKTQVDPDEMRRRIEETRSRLKAKAFDSMVEGETLLATGEEIEQADDAGAGSELDEETDGIIDDLLDEDD